MKRHDLEPNPLSVIRTLIFDSRFAWSMALLPLLFLFTSACTPKLEPVFDEHHPALLWPPPPSPPRIRYIGQLKTSADLKPPPKPFQALGDLLLGKVPPDPLLGPRSIIHLPEEDCLWIADPGGRCLHRFDITTRDYMKITQVGESPLIGPVGVCVGPSGSFYVCDAEDVSIHRLAVSNGSRIDTLRIPSDILRPVAMSYDDAANELYVVDVKAHDIKVLDGRGQLLRIIGQRGSGPGTFNYPCAIAADAETLWIADAGNHRVQALTRAGEPILSFGQAGDAPGDLSLPKAIALDGDGHLYVVDSRFENVQIFDEQGQLLLFFGEEGNGPGEFWLPSGIFIGSDDRIWICDSYNARIQVFDYLPETGGISDTPEQVESPPSLTQVTP